MSTCPGRKLENLLMYWFDLIVAGDTSGNLSLSLAEAMGNVTRRGELTDEQFAEVVALYEPYRADIEHYLDGFDDETHSWRDYGSHTMEVGGVPPQLEDSISKIIRNHQKNNAQAPQQVGMETDSGGIASWDEPRHTSVNDAAACRQQDLDIADCVSMLVTGLIKPWSIKTQTRATWMGQIAPPVLMEVGWLSWQLGALNSVAVDAGEFRLTTGRGSAYYVSIGSQKIMMPGPSQRDDLLKQLKASHGGVAMHARGPLLARIARCPENELLLTESASAVTCGPTSFFLDNHDQLVELTTMLNEQHKRIVAPAFDSMKEQLKQLATAKM